MITSQQNLDLALQIFHYAGNFHLDFSHNYETYHAIISHAHAFEDIKSLLSYLNKSQLKCGGELFITVIRNYSLAGRPKLSLETFICIEFFGVQRCVRSLNTLLNALVQKESYVLVHLVFVNCEKSFGVVPNVFTSNILIKALCNSINIDGALKLLDEMPTMGMVPNVVTYTIIMEIGRLDVAIKIMDEIDEEGINPNDVTYGVMIEAYCKENKSGEALKLLYDMLEKKYIPTSTLSCKVIDALCKQGKVEDACQLWKRLLKKNCTLDNTITSTLIGFGFCNPGKVEERIRILKEMLDKGCFPNKTYAILIKGLYGWERKEKSHRWWSIRKGGFGKVYLGILKDCSQVAIKLHTSSSKQGLKEFQTEVNQNCHRKPFYALNPCVQGSVRSLNPSLNALVQNKSDDLVHLVFVSCQKRFVVVHNVFTWRLADAMKIMDEDGIDPKDVTYGVTIKVVERKTMLKRW
ncbi:hypothetical protein FEM48_Zijuj07G0014700 [Ziziphus jujuba var. spinosa]|uniref:Uncharacterized protein n=1 Tax=Ziziphus jujuba var. spinosa TaxID=714518 RepID=A0A978V1N2_ZIZJJ|nr:hypothetical protein FEM48_Zijuj07G0014700 [Ziziphus jujuba var. spinosa]